jgi:AcrR family transcriptional regulator
MSKGEETRSRILGRALELASGVGIEGLTLGALASSLELSKSGLFAHFRSREALQIAVLEAAAERFRAFVIEPALRVPRGEPRLRALVGRWLEWGHASCMPGGCVFVSAAVELDDRPGPVRDALVETQKLWQGILADAVRGGVEEGHFTRSTSPEQVAFELNAMMLGLHFQSRLLQDPAALDRLRTAFERLMGSIRAPLS